MLPKFLTNINWVSTVIKTFILLVVTKLPVRENTFTPKETNHSTANKRYRVPMRNRCGADQTVAEPTEPRLGSWSIRTQTAKPQTKAENKQQDDRVCCGDQSLSPAHYTAQGSATSFLTSRPSHHPRVGRAQVQLSRDLAPRRTSRKGSITRRKAGNSRAGAGRDEEAGPALRGGAS